MKEKAESYKQRGGLYFFLIEKEEEEPRGAEDRKREKAKEDSGLLKPCAFLLCVFCIFGYFGMIIVDDLVVSHQ